MYISDKFRKTKLDTLNNIEKVSVKFTIKKIEEDVYSFNIVISSEYSGTFKLKNYKNGKSEIVDLQYVHIDD